MVGGSAHETDYHKSKRSRTSSENATQSDARGTSATAQGWADLSRLMESSGISSSYNAPARADVMHEMQQTHGNRAVQRYFGGGEQTHDSTGYGLPFGLGDLARRGGGALGQLGQAAQQHAFQSIAGSATGFASNMASEVLGDTPLGPMLGIPEKKSFLESLPLIGGMAGRGAEVGSSVLNGAMGMIGALGQQETPNTRHMPLPLAGVPFLGAPDMRTLLDQGHEMGGGGTGFGWEAPGAGEGAGPYGYAKVNEYGGQEMGAGLMHEESDILGIPLIRDMLYGVDKQGTFGTDNGDTRYGALQNFGVYKTQLNPGGAVSGDMEALTGGYELSAGTDGATANIGYNLAAASVSAGQLNGENHSDIQARFGLSAGLSAAARGHWGDKDGDGYSEYGLGGDLGIFSADLKTEDPLGALVRGGGNVIPGVSNLLDHYVGDYNFTHGTSRTADNAAAQEAQNYSWVEKMRAEEEDNYDSQMPSTPYQIPYR